MLHEYSEPVSKLLTYGEVDVRRNDEPWPDYLQLGFTEEHVPDLIRMTRDQDLDNAADNSLEVWGPLHAWRTLGQLGAVEAAGPLLRLFETLPDDILLPMELPRVLSMIGPAAIPAICEFLEDADVDEIDRISAPACLERMALDHPQHRDACGGALERQLASFATNGPILNAFLILSLSNLQATEAIGTIRAAFSADLVDLSVHGDIEDVEIAMGLRLVRETPRPRFELIQGLTEPDDDDWNDALDLVPIETVTNPVRHVGRNDPCPCGSGKKFKKCCLA